MIGNIVEKRCIEIILQQKGEIKTSPFSNQPYNLCYDNIIKKYFHIRNIIRH